MTKKNPTYTVLHDFKDLQDKNKIYRTGETYPTPANKKVSDERLKELQSKNNKLGIQLISADTEIKETKEADK